MGLNILTLGSSKTYTRESLLGGGAVVGKNVTVSSITPIDGGNRVTFSYTLDNGTVKTSTMDVMDGKDGIDGTNGTNGKDGQPGKDGSDGIGISKIEKIGTVDLVDTYRITFTDNSTFDYEVKNGKDGTGGTGASTWSEISDKPFESLSTDFSVENGELKVIGGTGSGEENVIESIKVNGVTQTVAADKSVDISVPDAYDDTALSQRVTDIESDYLKADDISGKVDKVDGKSLIADSEITRLASVDNYDDTQVKTQIQAVANGLMDSVGYSADYKTIDIIAKNGVKKSVNVAPIISHASITELSDVDTTNKATGKALVYNEATKKHEYATISDTDEKVKMDASTDAKYLGELLDNITIANENGELKVKKLDGQEVTITEINYLKGLTMNVMDLVNMFSNGGVKIINTPVATYAELLTLDKSSFIEGISYLVYVLADENHDNAKTTYLVDKDSETPTYFGFADSQRDFTTNPIDLATEITGKLGIANMDSDAIKALFTVDDTYKTETATNNAFSTHGAKALYDELLIAIGNKANDSDLTAHKDDTDIHVSTEDRTKWDSAKTHADSAHAPSNAQANVLETVKVNGTALTPSSKAVNIDLSDYAKTADIPTTLPANGGNSDTVNNHTVETDVPTDAKFTDTVYDDTDVKNDISTLQTQLDGHTVKKDVPSDAVFTDTNTWRDVTTSLTSTATDVSLAASAGKNLQDQITTVNSNLNELKISDIAGGKNLWNIEEKTYTNSITDVGNNKFQAHLKLNGKLVVQKSIMENGRHELRFNIVNKGLNNLTLIHSGITKDIFFVSSDFNSDAGDYVLSFNVDGWDAAVVGGIRFNNIQLEKGTTATDYEPYIPSVKMLYDNKTDKSETTTNLLNPTLKTSTSNGITCTDNGDGTYTLNGTATEWGFFNLNYKNLSTKSIPVGIYKVVGGVKDISLEVMASSKSLGGDSGNGYTFEIKTTDTNSWLRVVFSSGKTFNNVLIKPMLTTNLSATYDDFVPYTGDGETLASDVAEIKKDLGGLTFSASGTTLTITDGTKTWTIVANS